MEEQTNTPHSKLITVDLEKEMKKSFLEYSMSVIVARALPDVRDGLKPVHRRILYTMHENGLTPDKAYRKCADTVGAVLGRYHPHGDASVYDAMVRMAQDFSLRYPLIDGHGNFGSIDGHPAAAYRYTEARMSKMALDMLADIDKDTVDFASNYDGDAYTIRNIQIRRCFPPGSPICWSTVLRGSQWAWRPIFHPTTFAKWWTRSACSSTIRTPDFPN